MGTRLSLSPPHYRQHYNLERVLLGQRERTGGSNWNPKQFSWVPLIAATIRSLAGTPYSVINITPHCGLFTECLLCAHGCPGDVGGPNGNDKRVIDSLPRAVITRAQHFAGSLERSK